MNPEQVDIAIVGAGITGLMAADRLQTAGYSILVLDKGFSAGGRMATKSIGAGRADYGAQFFTVRTAEFGTYVKEWLANGVAFEWTRGWSEDDGYPRYAGVDGLARIPWYLAQKLDVRNRVKVSSATPIKDGWQLSCTDGQVFKSQALLLTSPVPQSLRILDAGHVQLTPKDRSALEEIGYAPCISVIFRVDGPVNLPDPGAVQQLLQPIAWLADNQRKGISPQETAVTVHAGPIFSQAHWGESDEEATAKHRAELGLYLSSKTAILETIVHRWRYSLPINLHPARRLIADNLPALVFAGDAFKEPRVEGAALSGLSAATAMDTLLG